MTIWILTLILSDNYMYVDGGVFRYKHDCEEIRQLIKTEEGPLICREVTLREE